MSGLYEALEKLKLLDQLLTDSFGSEIKKIFDRTRTDDEIAADLAEILRLSNLSRCRIEEIFDLALYELRAYNL